MENKNIFYFSDEKKKKKKKRRNEMKKRKKKKWKYLYLNSDCSVEDFVKTWYKNYYYEQIFVC